MKTSLNEENQKKKASCYPSWDSVTSSDEPWDEPDPGNRISLLAPSHIYCVYLSSWLLMRSFDTFFPVN